MILNEFKKGCKTCFMGKLLIFNRNLTMSHTNKRITCFVSEQEGKQLSDLYDSQILKIHVYLLMLSVCLSIYLSVYLSTYLAFYLKWKDIRYK